MYMNRESASRFSRGTVLNTLKQSRISIMRGKKGRNYISRQACFVNRFTLKPLKREAIHETGLSGNLVASFFPSHSTYVYEYIYMLFAGWEVRMVENCDRGRENAALGRYFFET